VVWQSSDGSSSVIRAATRTAAGSWSKPPALSSGGHSERPHVAGGSWSQPATLSDPAAATLQPQVAVNPRGDAVAAWASFDGRTYVIQSTSRPLDGVWSRAQEISPRGPKERRVRASALAPVARRRRLRRAVRLNAFSLLLAFAPNRTEVDLIALAVAVACLASHERCLAISFRLDRDNAKARLGAHSFDESPREAHAMKSALPLAYIAIWIHFLVEHAFLSEGSEEKNPVVRQNTTELPKISRNVIGTHMRKD
jgi:hypothetical protein